MLANIDFCQMHDLSVRELSVRLGGSRTGLLNASMVSSSMRLGVEELKS